MESFTFVTVGSLWVYLALLEWKTFSWLKPQGGHTIFSKVNCRNLRFNDWILCMLWNVLMYGTHQQGYVGILDIVFLYFISIPLERTERITQNVIARRIISLDYLLGVKVKIVMNSYIDERKSKSTFQLSCFGCLDIFLSLQLTFSHLAQFIPFNKKNHDLHLWHLLLDILYDWRAEYTESVPACTVHYWLL